MMIFKQIISKFFSCFGLAAPGPRPAAFRHLRLRILTTAVALLSIPLLNAEKIPLYSGQVIDREILEHNEKGLVIITGRGTIRLRWDQISPRFPLHPNYRPEETSRTESPAEEDHADSPLPARTAVSTAPPISFSIVLAGVFIVFWVNMLSVWLVTRERLGMESKAPLWNLATLILGLPVALIFLWKYKGFRKVFRKKGKPGLPVWDKKAPSCQFYTWDNEALKSQKKRKGDSGLAVSESIMGTAVSKNASDVHFDTDSSGVKICMRVDGVLREPEFLAPDIGRKAMTAIKTAAGMDVAKLHEAQDGACHLDADGEWYDLRIARAWAVEGETLVVRLLKTGGLGSDLEKYGMLPEIARTANSLTEEAGGIIIFAGPTGSGKTTTIYSLLRKVVGTGRNILTIEDPVEYRLESATQISLNARTGATFASALKASMRHDPDVILVGEIRDSEAMDVAFQAALTGHLVFTTLHATSVLATFGRLHELGLSAYMINTGLKAVICQRLVRKLCPSCRETYVPEDDELAFWELERSDEPNKQFFYRPAGCRFCEDSGYHGRTGVFRMLTMNNEVRSMLKEDTATGDLQEAVDEQAEGTIRNYAEELLWTGLTSTKELRKTLDMFDFGKTLGHHH